MDALAAKGFADGLRERTRSCARAGGKTWPRTVSSRKATAD